MNKTIKSLLAISLAVAFFTPTMQAKPQVYPYKLNTRKFPANQKKKYQPLCWADFDNIMVFPTDKKVSKNLGQSKVWKFLEFNVGKTGRVPELAGANPQRGLTESEAAELKKRAGKSALYMGGKTGESDATFAHLGEKWFAKNFPNSQFGQYLKLLYFAENLAQRSHGQIGYGHNLWGHHYMAKNLPISIHKAQLFYRNTLNPMVHMCFLRGASRQYGLSYWTQFSGAIDLKNDKFIDKNRKQLEKLLAIQKKRELNSREKHKLMKLRRRSSRTPTGGNSYSATRRMLYYNWLVGSRAFKFELGHVYRGSAKLTPIGQSMKHIVSLQKSQKHPGIMQTPIAIMTDFFQGWRPPEIKGGKRKKKKKNKNARLRTNSWCTLDYKKSDWEIASLLDLFYQGWMNNARFPETEKFLMPATKFGDSVDMLLSDTAPTTLNRYSLLIWSGQAPSNPLLVKDKIQQFADQGKTVILNCAAGSSIYPKIINDKKSFRLPAGAIVKFIGGQNQKQSYPTEIASLRKTTKYKSIASWKKKPLAISIPAKNSGQIIIILSKTGMISNFSEPEVNNEDEIFLAKNLPAFEREIIENQAEKTKLFSVGKDLTYMVLRKAKNKFTVAIFNDDIKSKPIKIESHIGKIVKIRKVKLDTKYCQPNQAWLPSAYRNSKSKTQKGNIAGKDVKIFTVTIKPDYKTTKIAIPEAAPKNIFLQLSSLSDLRYQLAKFPDFHRLFAGVAVDAKSVLSLDPKVLAKRSRFFMELKSPTILLDATKLKTSTEISKAIKTAGVLKTKKLLFANPLSPANKKIAKTVWFYNCEFKIANQA